jgi:hypothetical protein
MGDQTSEAERNVSASKETFETVPLAELTVLKEKAGALDEIMSLWTRHGLSEEERAGFTITKLLDQLTEFIEQ